MKSNQIKQIKKVYNWMAKKGIDLKNFEPSNYLTDVPMPTTSFKQRAEQVKHSFNHKFTQKRDIDCGILALFERVNQLKFERKRDP